MNCFNNFTWFLHWSEEEKGSVLRSGDTCTIPNATSTVAISEECAIRLLRNLILMPDTMRGPKNCTECSLRMRRIPKNSSKVEFGNILKYVPKYFRSVKQSVDVVYVLQDDSCGKYFEYFRQGPEVT